MRAARERIGTFGCLIPTAQKAGVTLREELAPDLPMVECDASQMQQVILNLVMNAIQASPASSEIVIRTLARSYEVCVEVIDQGTGVTPETREELFTPFFTTKTDGMGLGLPIAQQIVMNHGGQIAMRPNSPAGSVFTIRLPMKHHAQLEAHV